LHDAHSPTCTMANHVSAVPAEDPEKRHDKGYVGRRVSDHPSLKIRPL